MTDKDIMIELDEMRSQFGELKSMIKGQTILNGQMMRKAMKGDYNKMRRDLKRSIIFEVLAMPLQFFLLPCLGLPMWFTVVTLAFLLTALAASVYSLLHYASDDLMTGNLTDVALRIVAYKRFGICWFFYAIPFLLFWLFFFFYYITQGQVSDFVQGVVQGGVLGGVIGAVLGIVNYAQNLKRMNRILRQIKEVKGL